MNTNQANWPELKFEDLKDTIATVQLWTQIVGKIRLSNTPWTNQSWHVTLYVSPKGLTTDPLQTLVHKSILGSTVKFKTENK